jgi:hypothetical protein
MWPGSWNRRLAQLRRFDPLFRDFRRASYDCLADWLAIAEMNRGLALQVHRAALTVTGARPALICIHDAE